MCSPQDMQLITEIIDEAIDKGDMFTAHVIATEAQKRGVSEEKYRIKRDIHNIMRNKSWDSSLQDVGAPKQAFVYFDPMSHDPDEFVPFNRNAKPAPVHTSQCNTFDNDDGDEDDTPATVPASKATTAVDSCDGSIERRGRIGLSAGVVRKAGFNPNQKVYLIGDISGRALITIAPAQKAKSYQYTVDKDCRIRLSQKRLKDVQLNALNIRAKVSCINIIELEG